MASQIQPIETATLAELLEQERTLLTHLDVAKKIGGADVVVPMIRDILATVRKQLDRRIPNRRVVVIVD